MRRPYMARERASIVVRDLDMEPLFRLDFYGLSPRDLAAVPGGGDYVAAALERRGIDPHSVVFTLWDVCP
jgi:hypothetical protein